MFRMKGLSLLLLACLSAEAGAQQMNQAGYISRSVKRLFLDRDYARREFVIYDISGQAAFRGMTTRAEKWSFSGTRICFADFSGLTKPGTYQLQLEGSPVRIAFRIAEDSYSDLLKKLLKSFYFARSSVELEKEYAGVYSRPAGHPDTMVYVHPSAASPSRPAGSVIRSPGGWYDAGDYNKYIVNSGITTFTLLHATELFPALFANLEMEIPESGNGIPDILDEVLVNLRWMMTMQDPADGGVYHKLTSKRFCGMIPPYKDTLTRYVVMKTTAASLDLSSVLAKASRIFRNYPEQFPGLADSCLQMAQKAWNWSQAHPDILYEQPPDITTGLYRGKDDRDEKLWAALELSLATGRKEYLQGLEYIPAFCAIPNWSHVGMLGLLSWLSSSQQPQGEWEDLAREQILRLAEKYFDIYARSAYRVSLDTFPWGSNSELANQGMIFLHAYQLTGERRFLEAADASLGYLLGANPVDYCFVTGVGHRSPMHIHDRRSASDNIDEPIPGLLVGGPSLQAREDCGEDAYPSRHPALSYIDLPCSYSTNEVAINWNAAIVFLVSGLEHYLNFFEKSDDEP